MEFSSLWAVKLPWYSEIDPASEPRIVAAGSPAQENA